MTQKDMKFRVKDEAHSQAIQEKLFEMGYAWEFAKGVQFTEEKFLTAYTKNKKICFMSDEEVFRIHYNIEHILAKDGEIVPLVDDDGYIYWNGGECPVPNGTLVDVKYRDGHIEKNIPARVLNCVNTGQRRVAYNWMCQGGAASIVAYKLSEKQPTVEAPQDTKQEPPVLRPQKEMWLDRAAELLAAMSASIDKNEQIPWDWIEELTQVNDNL